MSQDPALPARHLSRTETSGTGIRTAIRLGGWVGEVAWGLTMAMTLLKKKDKQQDSQGTAVWQARMQIRKLRKWDVNSTFSSDLSPDTKA